MLHQVRVKSKGSSSHADDLELTFDGKPLQNIRAFTINARAGSLTKTSLEITYPANIDVLSEVDEITIRHPFTGALFSIDFDKGTVFLKQS